MSERAKEIHKKYCDYEVAKANKNLRILTVRAPKRQMGIRTSGVSRAILAQQLAALI